MLPVCGKLPPPGLGIGTALAVNCEILAVISAGATVAKPRAPRATRPSTARQVDALRIRFSPLLMDIRLDPGSSGAIAGPAISRSPAQRRRTLASLLRTTYPSRAGAASWKEPGGRSLAAKPRNPAHTGSEPEP